MNFSAILRRIGALERSEAPKILVFGDSHTAALSSAQRYPKRASEYRHIEIFRLRKSKEGTVVGDTSLDAFCRLARRCGPSDLIFSAIGGNQYSVVSTVRNPIDFDFLASPADEELAEGATLVPFHALAGYIENGIRGNDEPVLRRIRDSTRARIFHLVPPPPKRDNAFIASRFESRFVADGIKSLGPSRPDLRLKCWKVQLQSLLRVCSELGIKPVLPPRKALTADGFLAPRYYADDVTHGNRRYGELVLTQILEAASEMAQFEAAA